MAEAPAPLAYVFFHAPAPSVAPTIYEAALTTFHRALAAEPVDGYLGSASHRVGRRPWAAASEGPALYEDWYVVRDWSALGTLNDAAVATARRAVHDAVAVLSSTGTGAIYRWRHGPIDLGAPRFAAWGPRAPGRPFAPTGGVGAEGEHGGGTFWQRQLAIGPAPELCYRSVGRARSLEAEWSSIELRLVVHARVGP